MSKQKKHARLYIEDLKLISQMRHAEIKAYIALRYCSYLETSTKFIQTKCTISQDQLALFSGVSRSTITRGIALLKKRFPNNLTVTRQLGRPAIIELVIIRDASTKESTCDANSKVNMLRQTNESHSDASYIYKQNNKHNNIVEFSSYFDSDF